jgi:hypothetical protein
MGKLYNKDFKAINEYFLNLVVLSKKSQKSTKLLNYLDKAISTMRYPSHTEELKKAQDLLDKGMMNFMQLKYPRAYFKLAITMNIYPIPIATIIVIMISQRFCQYSGQKLILVSLFAFCLLLVVMIWVEYLIRKQIKTSIFYTLIVDKKSRGSGTTSDSPTKFY